MEQGSPGPLRAAVWQRSAVCDSSGQTQAIEAVRRTCPAYLPGLGNKKGLTDEASSMFGSPGPLGTAAWQRSAVCDPSGHTQAIEAVMRTRPAYLPGLGNKKGLTDEASSMFGSPGRTRTSDQLINSQPLYQLSYRGMVFGGNPCRFRLTQEGRDSRSAPRRSQADSTRFSRFTASSSVSTEHAKDMRR